jgi:hypothetical protein
LSTKQTKRGGFVGKQNEPLRVKENYMRASGALKAATFSSVAANVTTTTVLLSRAVEVSA